MEDGLILGYDLCEEYSRISCYQAGELEPVDIEFVKKGNPCVMKTVICIYGSIKWRGNYGG